MSILSGFPAGYVLRWKGGLLADTFIADLMNKPE